MSDETSTEVFIYELRPGAAAAYERHHAAVWPEVIASLRAEGIVSYQIFRRDDLLISVLTRDSTHSAPWPSARDNRDAEWAALIDPLLARFSDESGQPLSATKIFDLDDYGRPSS